MQYLNDIAPIGDYTADLLLAAARSQAEHPPALYAVPGQPSGLRMSVESLASTLNIWRARGSGGVDPGLMDEAAIWSVWRRDVTSAEHHNEGSIQSMLISLRTLSSSDAPGDSAAAGKIRDWLHRHGVMVHDGTIAQIARAAARNYTAMPRPWRDPDEHMRQRARTARATAMARNAVPDEPRGRADWE